MKIRYIKIIGLLIIVIFTSVKITFSQGNEQVRTMVNAGQDLNTLATFSENKTLLAMLNQSKTLEIYDVKTGLLNRKINNLNGSIPKNLIFEGNEKLLVIYAYGKTLDEISLVTGEINKVSIENYDYPEINSTFDVMGQQWMKFYTHVTTNKSKDFYYYESPNNKYKIGVKSISKDTLIPTLKVSLFEDKKETVLIDTLTQFVFMKVFFSKDSKTALIDNKIYDLQNLKIISTINRIGKFGSSGIFMEDSNVPEILCKEGLLSMDNFEVTSNPNNAIKITKIKEGFTVEKYDFVQKKLWLYVYNSNLNEEVSRCEIDITNLIKEVSLNMKYLLTKNFAKNNAWFLIETKTGSVIKDLSSLDKDASATFVGNDLVVNEFNQCTRWDLTTNDSTTYMLDNFSKKEKNVISLCADGYTLKYNVSDYEARIWDLSSGVLVSNFKIVNPDEHFAWKVEFDKVNNEIILYKTNQTIRILDFNSGKVKKEFHGHSGTITQHIYSKNREFCLTNASDGKSIFWNVQEEKTLAEFVVKNGTNYAIITPDNYYLTKAPDGHFVHFTKGINVFPLEQFDLKFNRPDIIIDRLGFADKSLVNAYHAAYLKRLKKMNFNEDMLEDDFHLPEIKIENFEEMPILEDQGSIDLKLNLNDTKYKLDRINLWINDVAVYGTNGISLRDKNVKKHSTTLSVNLANGKNKVQVSVLNQAGAESYKETFEIESTAGKSNPDLYLITIGESKFQQSEFDLTYAAKDAEDMAALFQNSKAYANVFTKILTNEGASKNSILALKTFLEKADINDQVMIFIAGHGVLDANLDYYFATHEMDFANPNEKGLAYEDLESLLDGIKPLQKTLIIDACHSGEIDKDEMELAVATSEEIKDVQFRSVGTTAQPKLGMQNTFELTKSLFTDLRKGTGATVISSAGGMEFAMESGEWKNGLFTYVLINGVKSGNADLNKDGEIWLSELQKFVGEEVTKLSNGQQQPTSRIENQSVDFRVW